MLTHDTLRQYFRRRRQRIPYGAQLRASQRLARKISKTPIYKQSQQIAFYVAVAGEIDLRPLLKQAWKDDKTCYLPVIDGNELLFVNVFPGSPMTLNQYGIAEPVSGGLIAPQALDLVLTPLVAFDCYCHRIGMGGGFYDRTFAHTVRAQSHRPYMMGVAHYSQQTSMIRPEPWDVALDSVMTDESRF